MQSHSAGKAFPYQHSFTCGSDLRQGIDDLARYNNQERGNSSLDDQTPDEVNHGLPHPFAEAAWRFTKSLTADSEAYALHASRDDFSQKLKQFMALYLRRKALVQRLVKTGIWYEK